MKELLDSGLEEAGQSADSLMGEVRVKGSQVQLGRRLVLCHFSCSNLEEQGFKTCFWKHPQTHKHAKHLHRKHLPEVPHQRTHQAPDKPKHFYAVASGLWPRVGHFRGRSGAGRKWKLWTWNSAVPDCPERSVDPHALDPDEL